MAKTKGDLTFKEAIVRARGNFDPFRAALEAAGPQHVEAPPWDPDGIYQLALVGSGMEVQVLRDGNWVTAETSAPSRPVVLPVPRDLKLPVGKAKTLTMLFMDVSGWSVLDTHETEEYVTKALPLLCECLGEHCLFRNTWGDAVVAAFDSAVDAANAALEIRNFFRRATRKEGIASGLKCRIALHQGEAIILHNSITGQPDIFGTAVNIAARIEPITAPGHVFASRRVAQALEDVAGSGPRAFHIGPRKLPKDAGELEVYVVTENGEEDPRPLPESKTQSSEREETPSVVYSDGDVKLMLQSWLTKRPVSKSGEFVEYGTVDKELKLESGATKRLLPHAEHSGWKLTFQDAVFVATCDTIVAVGSRRSRREPFF